MSAQNKGVSIRAIVERGANAEITLTHTADQLQELLLEICRPGCTSRLRAIAVLQEVCRNINGHLDK